jgi:protein-S-isoprenylcysteine O-methyltransferase Ste14
MTDNHSSTTRPSTKVWTAIQHSSGLVAALGLFVAISAYSTDPDSGVVFLGLIVAFVGLIGFIVGWTAGRRHRSQGNKHYWA